MAAAYGSSHNKDILKRIQTLLRQISTAAADLDTVYSQLARSFGIPNQQRKETYDSIFRESHRSHRRRIWAWT